MPRARRRREDAPGSDHRHAEPVDLAIAAHALVELLLALDERGRVENDDVEAIAALGQRAQRSERVCLLEPCDRSELRSRGAPRGPRDGVGGAVDATHRLRAGARAGQPPRTDVGEDVEDPRAPSMGGEPTAIVGVIEEEAGLLPTTQIENEAHAVDLDRVLFGHLAMDDLDHRIDAFQPAVGRVGLHEDPARLERTREGSDDFLEQAIDASSVRRDDVNVVVAVDDQAGDVVAFAVTQAIGARARSHPPAKRVGGPQALGKETAIQRPIFAGKYADGDQRAGVSVTDAEQAAARIDDMDRLPGHQLRERRANLVGEHPRMSARHACSRTTADGQ